MLDSLNPIELLRQQLLQGTTQSRLPQQGTQLLQPPDIAPQGLPAGIPDELPRQVSKAETSPPPESLEESFLRGFITRASGYGETPKPEVFEERFRKSTSPAREFLANVFFGMASGASGQKFLSLRERAYNEWVDDQKLKLEKENQRRQQMTAVAQIASNMLQAREEQRTRMALENYRQAAEGSKEESIWARFLMDRELKNEQFKQTMDWRGQQLGVVDTPAKMAMAAAKGDPVKGLKILEGYNLASRPQINIMTADDTEKIADAIESGLQPPDLRGLYRNQGPVRAALARREFDLTTAQLDWNAITRYISTINSTQQVRLRQATQFAYDSLDIIEDLFNQWKAAGGVSGVKFFNKANLFKSKNLPGDAGAIATALEAQINDLVSELGTVYKGGNASTDESLRLAAANFQAEWNEPTFMKQLANVRRSLGIRRNSWNSRPAGISAGTKYEGTIDARTGESGAEEWIHDPKTGKLVKK